MQYIHAMSDPRPVVAVDLNGVLDRYTGWKDPRHWDPPREGAEAFLRELNPGGEIYVWNDMFDPFHNAHDHYALINGDLSGSWEGLDKDVIIANWYFDRRDENLPFFAGLDAQEANVA